MKRLAVFAAIIAVFSAAAAFGAVQDFGKFTVDVAAGWTATQDGPSAVIVKNDNTASLTITVSPSEGASAKDLAFALADQAKSSYPTVGTPEADSDGDYSWTMVNANGVENHALLRVDGGDFMLITMAGLDSAGEEISAMLGSIEDK